MKEVMVRLCLDEARNLRDKSRISLEDICYCCGYAVDKHKGTFYNQVKDILCDLQERQEIEQIRGKPPNESNKNDLMVFQLSPSFSPCEDFISFYYSDFDTMVKLDSVIPKPTLIGVYLHIKSYIFEYQESDNKSPYGFYQSIQLMSEITGYPRSTIDKALDVLVDNGIFRRHITGSYKTSSGLVQNAPNIYVLDDENANWNIKKLIKRVREQYNIKEFLPQVYNGRSIKE